MITNFDKIGKQNLGSFLSLPAYGWEGQGKEKKPAEKKVVRARARRKGGWGKEFSPAC